MIKRMNKVTSLLVAAAAVVSIVPASASEKMATQDGTIYNAVAFDGGKYLFEGYKNDEDNSGIYFYNGNEDKLLEDVDGYTTFTKYGTNSIVASKDGSEDDQYIIDMSTGKASDDENMDEIKINLENKLNSTFRKLDRYNNNKNAVVSESLTQLSNNQFGEVWFTYKATTENGVEATGFTTESGKYIDASVTANISVFNGTKMVKVEEFNEKEDGVTVTVKNDSNVIGQDSNYIYRIVDVNVAVDGVEGTTTKTYLQKISKAQGSTKDEAYLPKTVESFEILATEQNEDVNDAATELAKNANEYTVVDGTVYSYIYEDGRVNVSKYSTKRNEKLEYTLTSGATKELDTAVVKLVDTIDEKCENKYKESITTDVDGNVWFLNNGKIYRSVKGGEFEEMYTCDRTMDKLDVYNSSNLIVWNQANEIFATVAGKVTEEDKEDEKVEVVAGWVKNSDGTWSYNKADGTKATGWLNLNGTWYYLNNSGVMQTGWLNLGGTWYYMQSSGAMATGWANINGTWYYMQSSGAMATGWLNLSGTWYYMQSSGAMQTGWLNDNGTWYYLNSNGSMAVNTTVGGYKLGSNGAWVR